MRRGEVLSGRPVLFRPFRRTQGSHRDRLPFGRNLHTHLPSPLQSEYQLKRSELDSDIFSFPHIPGIPSLPYEVFLFAQSGVGLTNTVANWPT